MDQEQREARLARAQGEEGRCAVRMFTAGLGAEEGPGTGTGLKGPPAFGAKQRSS